MSCPFCPERLYDGQELMLENEHCVFLQQPQRVLLGSGFIIPRAHRETVFDLIPQEWAATQKLLIEAKALLDERWHPEGYNIGWNNGAVSFPRTYARDSQVYR